eukprot:4832449-Alexandrium_andersonii.AAC.1
MSASLVGSEMCIRDRLKARQCCNTPHSAIRPTENATSLQTFGPLTVQAQERPQDGSPMHTDAL